MTAMTREQARNLKQAAIELEQASHELRRALDSDTDEAAEKYAAALQAHSEAAAAAYPDRRT